MPFHPIAFAPFILFVGLSRDGRIDALRSAQHILRTWGVVADNAPDPES